MGFIIWYLLGLIGAYLLQIIFNTTEDSYHWSRTTPIAIVFGLVLAVGGPLTLGVVVVLYLLLALAKYEAFWTKEIVPFKPKGDE